VVIPNDSDAGSSHYNTVGSSLTQLPRWTTSASTELLTKREDSQESDDRTLQYLEVAKANIEDRCHKILGIRSPTPIGIITFEDVVDTILQKTSRDEKDYFDRDHALPLTKTKKLGDCTPKPTTLVGYSLPRIFTPKSERAVLKKQPKLQETNSTSVPVDEAPNSYQSSILPGKVRKRNVSKNEKITTVDGADDGHSHSSYTQNSQGGFHGAESSSSLDDGMLSMQESITELRNSSSNVLGNPYSHVKTGSSSLPSRKVDPANEVLRHVSAAPRIPNTLRRVTPFSRDNHSSFERVVDAKAQSASLTLPGSTMVKTDDPSKHTEPSNAGSTCLDTKKINDLNSILEDKREGHRSSSSETMSFNSWYGKLQLDEEKPSVVPRTSMRLPSHANSQGERLFPSRSQSQASEPIKPYDGFPPELLELEYDKENRLPNYVSKTLPRMPEFGASEREPTATPSREKSFHDDRALLPSQRKALNSSDTDVGGMRSSSLWF